MYRKLCCAYPDDNPPPPPPFPIDMQAVENIHTMLLFVLSMVRGGQRTGEKHLLLVSWITVVNLGGKVSPKAFSCRFIVDRAGLLMS